MTSRKERVRRFFSELRRRKVIRFAIGYAIIGAGITEGASSIFGPLGLSDGGQRAIAILVIAGFPVALVLSWVFDMAPHFCHQRDPSANKHQRRIASCTVQRLKRRDRRPAALAAGASPKGTMTP
jgi:hypothetical protein